MKKLNLNNSNYLILFLFKILKWKIKKYFKIFRNPILGIGDWGLGIGDWGLGPIPNHQYPKPNPPLSQFPINKNINYNKSLKISKYQKT